MAGCPLSSPPDADILGGISYLPYYAYEEHYPRNAWKRRWNTLPAYKATCLVLLPVQHKITSNGKKNKKIKDPSRTSDSSDE